MYHNVFNWFAVQNIYLVGAKVLRHFHCFVVQFYCEYELIWLFVPFRRTFSC